MALITDPQTARELAAKSHEARRRNKELREQAEREPQPEPQIAPEPQSIDVSCVRARLETLDKLMAQAEDDKQWDAYSRAYERMFRVWCTLTRTPGPGNLKPSQAKSKRPDPMPEPTPATPAQPRPSTAQQGPVG